MLDGEVGVFRKLEMDHEVRELVTNNTQLLPIVTDGFFSSILSIQVFLCQRETNDIGSYWAFIANGCNVLDLV